MGTAAAIVIFVGHMSVITGLWPVHVVHTCNTIARQVSVAILFYIIFKIRSIINLSRMIGFVSLFDLVVIKLLSLLVQKQDM